VNILLPFTRRPAIMGDIPGLADGNPVVFFDIALGGEFFYRPSTMMNLASSPNISYPTRCEDQSFIFDIFPSNQIVIPFFITTD
jgi:hypothetical protein